MYIALSSPFSKKYHWACGQTQGSGSSASTSESTSKSSTAETSSASSATGDGKTLVVYYSASGTTKAVAEKIAADANADTFETTLKEPYSDADLGWTDSSSRVNKEHDDTSLQDKVELGSTDVPDWVQSLGL